MKKRCLNLFSVPLLLSLLAACNTVRIHSWTDPQFAGRPIGKTMVLGVAKSDSRSRQYEALFVDRLRQNGIAADSLHALIQTTEKLSEEQLVSALKAQHYDSIIVTTPLSETERQQVVNTGYYPAHYGNYYGYYNHAYTLTYNTAYIESFLEFELETTLYDVKTEKLVWTGRKVVYDNRSDLTNMKGIIKGVIKDLRKNGMID